jgi:hypothetical protein
MAGILSTVMDDPLSNTGVSTASTGTGSSADPMAGAKALTTAENNAPPSSSPAAALTPLSINKTDPTTSMTGYSPTTRSIDPNTQTVNGQVNGILSQNNPLIQTARTQAAQTANARGLTNSSMAVQSGEQAAINTALPIAQSDAAIQNDVATHNMDTTNAATQFSAGAQNTGAQQVLQGNQATGLQTLVGQQQQALQSLRGDQAQAVAKIQGQYGTLMQTSRDASQQFSTFASTIGAIMADPNMTPETKQSQVDKQVSVLQTSMAVIGGISALDLNSLLTFG